MKVYKIKVNGKSYRVELEAIDEVASAAPTPAPLEAKKEPSAPKAPSAAGQQVLSPIQGTVNAIKVTLGQKVSKGTVLFIVEAMKLENEVVSPFDGTVTEILVEKGATVSSKQPLAVIG